MSDVPALVEHLFRHHAAALVATLARILGPRQLDLAEDVVQDALLSALRAWSMGAIPDNPRAWLTAVARNRALDRIRSDKLLATHSEELRGMLHPSEWSATGETDDALADDQLRLIFLCCHPAIPAESRTALTLKLAGGFSVAEIARAMLAEESAIAQRVVRAKRRIRDDGIPLTLPDPPDLGERLGSVLEVLYLMFNEGYLTHSSDEVLRRDLCHEALRMVLLLLRNPATTEPAVEALAALFCFQAARLPARMSDAGEVILLPAQDRARWDRTLIAAGLRHLARSARGSELSPYHHEAEIASCHAVAPDYASTDWARIVTAYDRLYEHSQSPVIALHRAVAVAELRGPGEALALVERVAEELPSERYYLVEAARADLYARLGAREKAAESYARLLTHTFPAPVRELFRRKLEALDHAADASAPSV